MACIPCGRDLRLYRTGRNPAYCYRNQTGEHKRGNHSIYPERRRNGMMKRKKHLWIAVLIPAILLFFILRFTLFYIRSDGFSGLSMLLPILLLCFILFAIGMSASFAAWVYMDCKKRGDDPILWTLVIIIATPFIGLLIYFLRR